MTRPATALARIRVETLDESTTVEQAVCGLGRFGEFALLESSQSGGIHGRFSILAWSPVRSIESVADEPDPWAVLKSGMGGVPAISAETFPVPFVGGWIGYLGYEAGTVGERIAPRAAEPGSAPGLRFALYDTAAVFDHQTSTWFAVAVEWPTECGLERPSAASRLGEVRTFLHAAANAPMEPPPIPRTAPVSSDLTHYDYLHRVARVKRHIEAGDVYQVNLTRRLTTRTTARPLALYRRLRAISPSTHAALLCWGDAAVISSSPELFLDLRGRHIVTRPIKGTRPRGEEPWKDDALRAELAESEKDRAELTMIVDLLRNDLGKVSAYGSIRVVEASRIEQHPTLFHQVATVEGTLRDGEDWSSLLAATFPGGSITGAPKIRAMQIIRELEPSPRGVYCGSIGRIGLDGDASFNIAIRTMFQRRDHVELHAGGGIVADSSAEEEYQETRVKLKGMLAALGLESAIPEKVPSS